MWALMLVTLGSLLDNVMFFCFDSRDGIVKQGQSGRRHETFH